MNEHIGKVINPDWGFREISEETAPELRYKRQADFTIGRSEGKEWQSWEQDVSKDLQTPPPTGAPALGKRDRRWWKE